MDQHITAAFYKQICCLHTAHIVVCIYAANVFVLTFNSNDRHIIGRKLLRGNGVAENYHSLNFVCKQLRNIFSLGVLVFVACKNKKLIAVFIVCGKYFIQYFRIIMQKKIRYNYADKLCLSVCKDTGNLIFLVIEGNKSIGYLLLIFKGQRVGIVEIS